ncbi:acyl-CoA dehydrogenase family protein [Cupriavidus pauculus]|uniref:acyl-CoA dehydrogenase family protein n=1 Tax=Cupriavidus pauculus TaxID=82633 RepID=UPI001FD0078F|nr:acyl-CoA dehydrogenase family protein [Cupriavidus pauculus]
MDLTYSDEDLAFRAEVMEFFRENVSSDIRKKILGAHKLTRDELADWHRILDSKGWAVPHWPVQWGGTGWSPLRQYIFRECLHMAPAPEPHVQNVNLMGPIIAEYGSDELKAEFLPKIRTMEVCFCQGFSEPNSGSDLASLRTRAVRDGDVYVVNGQKTWTTSAHMADWMFCLVKTDTSVKPQLGISYLLIDMKSPGVTVRPIHSIDGQHHLNEVFLEDVRVPAALLVGEENKGWDYSKELLAQERLTVARVGVCKRNLMMARDFMRRNDVGGLVGNGRAHQLVELEARVKALEILNLRLVMAAESNSNGGGHIPSMLKLLGAQLQQATSELLLDIAGPLAWVHGRATEEDTPIVEAATAYLHLRAASIYGGTNEIQKNLISRALLQG